MRTKILRLNLFFSATSALALTVSLSQAYAACQDNPGSNISATNSSVCLVNPTGANSSNGLNDPFGIVPSAEKNKIWMRYSSSTSGNSTIYADTGANLTIGGNISVINAQMTPGVDIRTGATTHINGNLYTHVSGSSLSALYIENASLHIGNNLYAISSVTNSNPTVFTDAGANLSIQGNALLYSLGAGATTFLNNGTATAKNFFVASMEANSKALENTGTLSADGYLRAFAFGSNSVALLQKDGSIEAKGELVVEATGAGSTAYAAQKGTGIYHNSVSLKAAGNGLTATTGQYIFNGSSLRAELDPSKVLVVQLGELTQIKSTGAVALEINNTATTADVWVAGGAHLEGAKGSIVDHDANSRVFVNEGAFLSGDINLGTGSDELILINNVNLDNVALVSGGDNVSSGDGMTDTLTFKGATNASLAGSKFVNWENIVLDQSHIHFTDQGMVTGSDEGLGLKLTNGSTAELDNNNFALTGNLTVDNRSVFLANGQGNGKYAISGDVFNSGTISLASGQAGDVLSIVGDYHGSVAGGPGTIILDTVLGDDNSKTDFVHIAGTATGTTNVQIINRGGLGAETTSDGIELIHVNNRAGLTGTEFRLRGDMVYNGEQVIAGGAYLYGMHYGGNVETGGQAADGSWYLRSFFEEDAGNGGLVYQPGVPLYSAYPQILLDMNRLGTWEQRVDNRRWLSGTDRVGVKRLNEIERGGFWMSVEGGTSHVNLNTPSGVGYDLDQFRTKLGLDFVTREWATSSLVAGIYATYGYGDVDVSSRFGSGTIHTKGVGVGGTLTWYKNNGWYLDGVAQVQWFRSDLRSNTLDVYETKGNKGLGYTLSIEGGRKIALNNQWSLTPQAQLQYSHTTFDDFTDNKGARIKYQKGESLQGRVGLDLTREVEWISASGDKRRLKTYGTGNVYHEFLEGSKISVTDVSFKSREDRSWVGLGTGVTYSWRNDRLSMNGEIEVRSPFSDFGDSYAVRGKVGFKVKF